MPTAKPRPKTTHEIGVIAGKFSIVLGWYKGGLNWEDNNGLDFFKRSVKELRAVLTIEPDHSWRMDFEVHESVPGGADFTFTTFPSLDEAVAHYNAIESKGAK